jgi:transcriptional regulator with XRE-family HTH domain
MAKETGVDQGALSRFLNSWKAGGTSRWLGIANLEKLLAFLYTKGAMVHFCTLLARDEIPSSPQPPPVPPKRRIRTRLERIIDITRRLEDDELEKLGTFVSKLQQTRFKQTLQLGSSQDEDLEKQLSHSFWLNEMSRIALNERQLQKLKRKIVEFKESKHLSHAQTATLLGITNSLYESLVCNDDGYQPEMSVQDFNAIANNLHKTYEQLMREISCKNGAGCL